MTNVSKISVALAPAMAESAARAVQSGDYASSGEVIREALREWKQRWTFAHENRARLAQLWAEGLASGPGGLKNMAAIKAEARRRLLAETPSAG
jgi:antitoxin ParD1/3/4